MKQLLIILASILIALPSYAKWDSSKQVLSGKWGKDISEFGFVSANPRDGFPEDILVDVNGAIIISDQINKRIKIFQDGTMSVILPKDLQISWVPDLWPTEKSIATYSNKIFETSFDPVQVYNFQGDLLATFNVGSSYFRSIDHQGNLYFEEEGEKYRKYSPAGELLATYDKKPLELGIETSYETIDDGNYRQVIEYEDAKYTIVTPGGIESYARDQDGYLYGVESVPGTTAEWHSRVHKFDPCGKNMGYLDLPDNDIRTEAVGIGTAPATLVTVVEEYGPPVIGPDGSVYAWKRTPDTYSILKWTWVDDPSDPQPGPDAPTNLKLTPSLDGLFLTWDASPQDPGCVDGYDLERATSVDGIYTTVTTTDPGVLNFNDTGALPGTSYFYRVRAKSDGIYSPYSDVVSGSR